MNNQKTELLNWLFSLHRFGIKPGTERIKQLLEFLGNPHHKIQTIHIAGTNGKGTTATTIASILKSAGYRVGLYTSPHLIDFNERIQINGKLIEDDYLIEFILNIKNEQEKTQATFFEITTALAFQYFSENKVDIAIIEAGMGGQNDATNVIHPILSIITPIGLDHQEYLGDTIFKIAKDKAGIFKPKSKALVSDLNLELTKLFENIADSSSTQLYFLDDLARLNDLQYANYKAMIDFTSMSKNYIVHSPLLGKHQAWNTICGATAVKLIRDNYPVNENHIIEGIEKLHHNFFFAGRFQIIRQNPLIIIDVAHNYDSFLRLLEIAEDLNLLPNTQLCFAIMADKEYHKIINLIEDKFQQIWITQPKIERAANPRKLYELFRNKNKVFVRDNVDNCLQDILQENQNVIFAGSFYLIGEVLQYINKNVT